MAYVYRFKHYITSEVIYVGKTNRKLKSRMNEHFNGKGHLSSKCYRKVGKIEYIELDTDADAMLIEQYMINKYKPIYNKLGKASDKQTTRIFFHKKWVLYEDRRKPFIRFNLFGFNPFKIHYKKKKSKKKKQKYKVEDKIFQAIVFFIILIAVLENI